MPAIKPERMQDRYEQILMAAREVFTQKGFEDASIAEIARAARVSDGLIYRYFENKRDLLYHVLRIFYEGLIAGVSKGEGGKGFAARLYGFIHSHLTTMTADGQICRLFIAEVRGASDYPGSRFQDLNRRYGTVIMKILKEGQASGEVRADADPRMVRDVIFGSIEHLTWGHVNGRAKLDVEATASGLTKLLVQGLARPDGRAA